MPTIYPTLMPTSEPSSQPTNKPTYSPTIFPTEQSISNSTSVPTSNFTSYQPTNLPTLQPSDEPTYNPTLDPTSNPSLRPSRRPTSNPTKTPSTFPTYYPSVYPTINSNTTLTSISSNGGTVNFFIVVSIFLGLGFVVGLSLQDVKNSPYLKSLDDGFRDVTNDAEFFRISSTGLLIIVACLLSTSSGAFVASQATEAWTVTTYVNGQAVESHREDNFNWCLSRVLGYLLFIFSFSYLYPVVVIPESTEIPVVDPKM
eukprot:gene20941-27142_t